MPGPFSTQEIQSMAGQPVYDAQGDKIGEIDEVYLDDATQQPEWVGVGVGFFGSKHTLVPLEGAKPERDGIRVSFDKDRVKNSPDVKQDAEHHISEETERELYSYYGLGFSEATSPSTLPDRQSTASETRQESRGRLQRLQLREEELRPKTETVQTGEARVTKDVVEEERTIEVPTTREEVSIERRPVEGRPPASGEVGSGEEIRVPINEERVEVDKETVVREEVEVNKQQVQETERVQETVRREEPRIEGDR